MSTVVLDAWVLVLQAQPESPRSPGAPAVVDAAGTAEPLVLLERLFFKLERPLTNVLYRWLWNHRLFGPLLRNWAQGGKVSRRAKWSATLLMALSGIVLFATGSRPWVAGIAITCMVCVAAWLWRGEWFEAYDAALWLIAFATLEMDVLGFTRKQDLAA